MDCEEPEFARLVAIASDEAGIAGIDQVDGSEYPVAEYVVAYMVAGFTTETLPIRLFNSLRYGHTPTMASVTVVFVVLAALVFGLIARFDDLPRLLGAWSSREDQRTAASRRT